MRDRVLVVDPHNPIAALQRLEITPIVALLLAAMPLSAVNLDDDAALNQKVNTSHPRNHDLRRHP